MSTLSVTDAQAIVLRHADHRYLESVPLQRALGRVLAEDILANRDQPPCDVSGMDGFAVRSTDLENSAATLTVVEDIQASDTPKQQVGPGQCARIMTGAPLPAGADAVVRVEDTQTLDDGRIEIAIAQSLVPGNDIRRLGESLRQGQLVLPAGTEITPGVVGVLATVKAAQVAVFARPKVAILATGNELEALDEPLDPFKIPDANSHALMAQCQALGIEPAMLGIARDDAQELARYLQRGLDHQHYDVLLVSGGSSVGTHDHVRPTLEALGVTMRFWRVDMRPGHPVALGTTADGVLVFCLPGNPVSSMVCFEQFVLPALRSLMGHRRLYRPTVSARLAHAVKTRPGRTEFVRVALSRDSAGHRLAHSTGTQSSGVLLSMALADGLLVVPADASGVGEGETAVVQLLEGTGYQESAGFQA